MSNALQPERFASDVLLVFIGHSDDATDEAIRIRDLEREMVREWENLELAAQAVNGSLPFKTIRTWEWNFDAPPQAGGQEGTIIPSLDRANVALFVFKERVGAVTWAELERSRSRTSPSIPIAAFFPANPPDSSRMTNLQVAEEWTDLLRKQQSLTADWTAPGSTSLRRITQYNNGEELGRIVLEQMKQAFVQLLGAFPKIAALPGPEPPPKTFFGDRPELSHDRQPVLMHSVEELEPAVVGRFLDQPLALDQLRKSGMADGRATVAERLKVLGCLTTDCPAAGTFYCFAPAALLVDKFGSCTLQLVIYDQTRKAESSPSISIAKGNLLTLYEEGMNWLRAGSGLRRSGRVGSAGRDDLEIPEIVLREALANGLIHRDYATEICREQPTRVEVFPDRVELTSYGNLLKPYLAAQLNSDTDHRTPWRRNPLIAEIFQYMGHVELNASGVSRMRWAMEQASLAFPKFLADPAEHTVRVVLLRPAKTAGDEVSASASPRPGQLRAVISSTVAELPEHRQIAIDVCRRHGFFPIVVEDQTPDAWMRMVETADVFIGIYGHRYGFVPHGSNVSLAEMEFDRTRELGIPVLVFTMHDEHPVTRSMIEQGEAAQEKLAAFQQHVRQTQSVGIFKSAEDLRGLLSRALASTDVKPRILTEGPEDARQLAMTLEHLGDTLQGQGHFEEAIDAFERSLEISERLGDTLNVVMVLNSLGEALRRQGKLDRAAAVLRRGVTLAERLGDDRALALTLNNLGTAFQQQGNFTDAVVSFRRSSEIFETLQDERGQAMMLNMLGGMLQRQGDFRGAADVLRQSAAIEARRGDERGEAMTLNSLGAVLQRQGLFDEALAAFRRSHAALEKSGDQRGQSMVLNSLGGVLQRQGHFEEAIDAFRRSAALADTIMDRPSAAMSLSSLARALQRQGKLSEAADAFRRSISIAETMGDRRPLVFSLNGLGDVLQRQGKLDEAADVFRRSAANAERTKDLRSIAIALNGLANVLQRQGHLDDAVATLRRSVTLSDQLGDERSLSMTLNSLGRALQRQQDFGGAIAAFQRALNLATARHDSRQMAYTKTQLGRALLKRGLPEKAMEELSEAFRLEESMNSRRGVAAVAHLLIEVLEDRGRRDEALEVALRALAIVPNDRKIAAARDSLRRERS